MINCRFCHRPCRKVDVEYVSYPDINWQCDYHGAVRVCYAQDVRQISPNMQGELPLTTFFICNHNEQTYHVYLYREATDSKFVIYHVTRQALSKFNIRVPVVALDYYPPDITPDNVMNKLATYLLFS